MDINQFYLLGFNRTEVKLYLGLLEFGKTGAQQLANRLNLPRSTVYSGLDALAAKGIIRKQEKRGSAFFVADNPESLGLIVEREKELVSKREQVANELISQLKPLCKAKGFSVPKLEFIEGKRKVEHFLYEMLPVWRDSILKYEPVSTWGYQDHTFVNVYSKWIKEAWKVLHEEAQIPGQIMSNFDQTELDLVDEIPRRAVHFLDPNSEFNSSIWVMGDYIVMIMTRHEPYYAFQIHDPVFAANLREVFRHLYVTSKPLGEMLLNQNG